MVKGITTLHFCSTAEQLERVRAFLAAFGFEPGKGWSDQRSTGHSFLAPVGNLEIVHGSPYPSDFYIEVTDLDDVHRAALAWGRTHNASVRDIAELTWGARSFTAEPAEGFRIAFWEWDTPRIGKPIGVEGDLSAQGMRFGIVVARWNAVITNRLLDGAIDALVRSGARRDQIELVRVPGSWEIPSAARTLAESGRVDAVIAIGCLIRGETAHYEAIYNEVARGIGQSQQDTGVPHTFGVLTTETLEQALDRAGLKAGNKGFEAAIAAIEMVSVTRKIRTPEPAHAG